MTSMGYGIWFKHKFFEFMLIFFMAAVFFIYLGGVGEYTLITFAISLHVAFWAIVLSGYCIVSAALFSAANVYNFNWRIADIIAFAICLPIGIQIWFGLDAALKNLRYFLVGAYIFIIFIKIVLYLIAKTKDTRFSLH